MIPVPIDRPVEPERDAPDAVRADVGDIEPPGGVERHADGGIELRQIRSAAIADLRRVREKPDATTRDGRNEPRDEVDPPHAAIAAIGEVEVLSRGVDDQEPRGVEVSQCGRAAIVQGNDTAAGDGLDAPRGIDSPEAGIASVRDVKVVRHGVKGDAEDVVERRRRRRAVARKPRAAGSGKGRDHAVRAETDPADAQIARVGDVQVPGAVEDDGARSAEGRGGRRPAIARERRSPGPHDGRDDVVARVDKALEAFEDALRVDPSRSYMPVPLRPSPLAEDLARKAAEQANMSVDVRTGNRFDSAAQFYALAVDDSPWWAEGYFNLAVAQGAENTTMSLRAAIADMKRFLALTADAAARKEAEGLIEEWSASPFLGQGGK